MPNYKRSGRVICRTSDGVELFLVDRAVNRNCWAALSPTEVDALCQWLLEQMNAPGFDLKAIHAAYMADYMADE